MAGAFLAGAFAFAGAFAAGAFLAGALFFGKGSSELSSSKSEPPAPASISIAIESSDSAGSTAFAFPYVQRTTNLNTEPVKNEHFLDEPWPLQISRFWNSRRTLFLVVL